MKYIPVTKEQNEEMLKKIGVNSVDELFSVIPDEVLLKEDLNIGEALSEIELKNKFKDLSNIFDILSYQELEEIILSPI